MEEGTRKKQRNSSHWKNTSPSSYSTSSQVVPLGFSNTSHSGLIVRQIAHKFQPSVVTTTAKIWGKGGREVGIKMDTHQPGLSYSIPKTYLFLGCLLQQWWRLSTWLWKQFPQSDQAPGSPFTGSHKKCLRIRPEKVVCSLVDVFQFVLRGSAEKQAKKSVFKPKKEVFLLLAIMLKGVFVSIFLFVLFLFQLS